MCRVETVKILFLGTVYKAVSHRGLLICRCPVLSSCERTYTIEVAFFCGHGVFFSGLSDFMFTENVGLNYLRNKIKRLLGELQHKGALRRPKGVG